MPSHLYVADFDIRVQSIGKLYSFIMFIVHFTMLNMLCGREFVSKLHGGILHVRQEMYLKLPIRDLSESADKIMQIMYVSMPTM